MNMGIPKELARKAYVAGKTLRPDEQQYRICFLYRRILDYLNENNRMKVREGILILQNSLKFEAVPELGLSLHLLYSRCLEALDREDLEEVESILSGLLSCWRNLEPEKR